MSDLTRIRSNVQALNVLAALRNVNRNTAMHQLRLATGKRINNAGDDPAGLTIATKLNSRNKILQQVYDNLGEAKNFMAVAEGGLSQINDILTEIGAKVERAASDTIGTAERQAVSAQVVQLINEIDSVATDTQFNGVKLLNATSTFTFQTNETSQTVFSTQSYTTASLQMTQLDALTASSVIDSSNYLTYLSEVDAARTTVLSGLTTIGSLVSRFTFKEEAIQVAQMNTEAAYSRIMDADLAQEQLNYTKFQILQQSTTAMLAQANLNSQSVLALISR